MEEPSQDVWKDEPEKALARLRDAAGHRLHVLLLQARGRTVIADVGARVASLDAWLVDLMRRRTAEPVLRAPLERGTTRARAHFRLRGGAGGLPGAPIFGRDSVVIGHLAFVHGQPLVGEDVLMQSVCRIFTARAGVEIELDQALNRLDAAPPQHPVSHRGRASRT